MAFARWVFWIAGAYGMVVLGPQYFLEGKFGTDYPPAIKHPEFYYGFLGVAIAWQIAFVVIGRDPVRFRPMMLPSVVEKFSFAGAVGWLFYQNRVPAAMVGAGFVDFCLGVLFLVAWHRTRTQSAA